MQSEPAPTSIGAIAASNSEHVGAFSADNPPKLEDFGWYAEVFQNGMYREATPITELSQLLGKWNGYIVYDPNRNMDGYARELAQVEISAMQSGVRLMIDWCQLYWEGEAPQDETELEDTSYEGSFEKGACYLTGPGNITLQGFYQYQGVCYGFGTLLTPDGILADFCLVR